MLDILYNFGNRHHEELTEMTKRDCICTVGVDIGGTNTVIGLVDREGRILCRNSLKTCDYPEVSLFVDALAKKIADISSTNHVEIAGIGIGAPCARSSTGLIEAAANLPWPSPIPLAKLVTEATGLPVMIGNDANAAAIGEMKYGAARGMNDFILLTLGTGVGSGLVCGGKLIEGHRGFAGELGHMKAWRQEGRICACGRKDCLQTYCSASGVATTVINLLNEGKRSSLSEIPADKMTAKDVVQAAEVGDYVAIDALNVTGEVLGDACAQYATFSDPEAIILFGGVAHAGHHLTDAVVRAFRKNALGLYRDHMKFLLSALPESDAALLGASALGWQAASDKENI